ncbi:hypothetical protein H072_2413 [Dactylellina haptotyla CBS 200.50]|uniref:Uncharacterized protein n=1 Tax=Dactylellina haptotyla (strain CBS 200.50) TaxID=1284197 RepID=S8ARM0_DACHA|nr:hypothetical protein H072_2413 [Dactylellina haptotyla CBS 200.50]
MPLPPESSAERDRNFNQILHGKRYLGQLAHESRLQNSSTGLNKPLPLLSNEALAEYPSDTSSDLEVPLSLPEAEIYTDNIPLHPIEVVGSESRAPKTPKQPKAVPRKWWDIRRYYSSNRYSKIEDDDAASDSSDSLETIWIEVDMEARLNQEVPPLPPRKDWKYRENPDHRYEWKLVKRYCFGSRESTPSDQGIEVRLPEPNLDDDKSDVSNGDPKFCDWLRLLSIILFGFGFFLFMYLGVKNEPPAQRYRDRMNWTTATMMSSSTSVTP